MTTITEPKLLALKEYMELFVDGGGTVWQIDPNSIADCFTPEETLRIFKLTGWMISTSAAPWIPPKELSFEDYYKNIYLVSPKNLIIPVQNQPLNI